MSYRLKLLPDYECFALWDIDSVGNVDPGNLPISDQLKSKISSWEDVYDSTLNADNPSESSFSSEIEEASFDEEGRKIWNYLKEELGGQYEVSYFSVLEDKLLT